MIPLHQAPGDNQCFRNCVASIFELPLAELPPLSSDGDQEGELRGWLNERGMSFHKLYNLHMHGEEPKPWYYSHGGTFQGLGIASGPTQRGTQHAVVWKHMLWNQPKLEGEEELRERIGSIGVMVHDPHPSGVGLLRVESFTQFIVTDPALYRRWERERAARDVELHTTSIGGTAGPKSARDLLDEIVCMLRRRA